MLKSPGVPNVSPKMRLPQGQWGHHGDDRGQGGRRGQRGDHAVRRRDPSQARVLARRVWDERAPLGFRVQVLGPDCLDHACAATGMPYEEISRDYSKVDFSSARMAPAAFHGLVDETQWQVIIPASATACSPGSWRRPASRGTRQRTSGWSG